MNKLIIGLLLSFFAFSGLQDNQIWIKAKMPYNVHAGDRITIEFTVNKLDLQHFAELRQKLPVGFKAVEKQSGAADFSFRDQMVKFTWLRLPRASQLTISYDVIIDQNIKGEFDLPAQFTYIYKNQRGTANLKQDRINVYARGDVFISTNNKEYNDFSFPPKNPLLVQCLRIRPTFSKEHNAMVVKLLISRGGIQSAAKVEEYIPNGFTATLLDSKNAAFVFENNKAEFVWTTMPNERNFQISYKISSNRPNQIVPNITGNFVYFSGGALQTTPIKEVEGSKLNKSVDKSVNEDEVKNFFNN